MASRFLDISAPVARALNTNALIVAIETGFFMRLPYPKNRDALAECEQAFSRQPWLLRKNMTAMSSDADSTTSEQEKVEDSMP